MASVFSHNDKSAESFSIADRILWYYAIILVILMITGSMRDNSITSEPIKGGGGGANQPQFLIRRPCDEIYVVQEGETLHTISDKCGDPFIVEKNPHIHDPDDVFPGLVIKITTYSVPSR